MKHDCIIEKQRDTFAYVEQYMVRCRCHTLRGGWTIWRPGDPEYVCPSNVVTEPRQVWSDVKGVKYGVNSWKAGGE